MQRVAKDIGTLRKMMASYIMTSISVMKPWYLYTIGLTYPLIQLL